MYFGKSRKIHQVMTVGQVIEELNEFHSMTPLVVLANGTPCGMLLSAKMSHAKDHNDKYVSVAVLNVET